MPPQNVALLSIVLINVYTILKHHQLHILCIKLLSQFILQTNNISTIFSSLVLTSMTPYVGVCHTIRTTSVILQSNHPTLPLLIAIHGNKRIFAYHLFYPLPIFELGQYTIDINTINTNDYINYIEINPSIQKPFVNTNTTNTNTVYTPIEINGKYHMSYTNRYTTKSRLKKPLSNLKILLNMRWSNRVDAATSVSNNAIATTTTVTTATTTTTNNNNMATTPIISTTNTPFNTTNNNNNNISDTSTPNDVTALQIVFSPHGTHIAILYKTEIIVWSLLQNPIYTTTQPLSPPYTSVFTPSVIIPLLKPCFIQSFEDFVPYTVDFTSSTNLVLNGVRSGVLCELFVDL